MTRRKLHTFDHYQISPRCVLRVGDPFRVSGGPVYITDEGQRIPMWERGTFKFRRYHERGAAKWIEAYRVDGGLVVLWVGKPGRSQAIPNLRRRPYRIKRVANSPLSKRRATKGGPNRT
jgi:hypothetical protein